MDSFSFDSSDSSISYSHYYPTQPTQPAPHQKSALHSVRKTAPPTKPWKKPTAPLPPNPTRVYQVDRMNFRELVQQLTGAFPAALPEANDSHSSRLHKVAPPPLDLAPAATQQQQQTAVLPDKSTVYTPLTTLYRELMSESMSETSKTTTSNSDHKFSDISLGLALSPSPSPLGWCSIPMLSPGTLSLFEPSSVL